MAKKKKEPSFEVRIKQLEDVVEKLETGEAGLEESLKLFEKGVMLLKECHGVLDAAEKKMELLLEKNGNPVAEPVPPEKFTE